MNRWRVCQSWMVSHWTYLICVVSDWRGCIFHMEIEFLNSDYKEECYVYSSFRQFAGVYFDRWLSIAVAVPDAKINNLTRRWDLLLLLPSSLCTVYCTKLVAPTDLAIRKYRFVSCNTHSQVHRSSPMPPVEAMCPPLPPYLAPPS